MLKSFCACLAIVLGAWVGHIHQQSTAGLKHICCLWWSRKKRRKEDKGDGPAHIWLYEDKRWRCMSCQLTCSSVDRCPTPCSGHIELFRKPVQMSSGHDLWVSSVAPGRTTSGTLIFCMTCGGFAFTYPKLLLDACDDRLTKSRSDGLNNIRAGWHLKQRRLKLTEARRLRIDRCTAQWFEQGRVGRPGGDPANSWRPFVGNS